VHITLWHITSVFPFAADLSIEVTPESAEVGHLAFGDAGEMDCYAGHQVSMRRVSRKVDLSNVEGETNTSNRSSRRSAVREADTNALLLCRYQSLRGSLEDLLQMEPKRGTGLSIESRTGAYKQWN
jgi:hypothetical protein